MLKADDRLLHAYLDRELPPDLSRAFEARLEREPALRAALQREQRIRSALAADAKSLNTDAELAAAAARVRASLDSLPVAPIPVRTDSHVSRRTAVLGALGAAAATAAFIFGLQGIAATGLPEIAGAAEAATPVSRGSADANDGGVAVTVGVQDVEQLLQILNARSGITELRIELPETPRFEIIGDPTLIRRPPHEASAEETP